MASRRNFFDEVAERVVGQITEIPTRFVGKEPPFGMEVVSLDVAETRYKNMQTDEARRAFREKMGTEATLELARKIVAKRGRFHP